MGTKLILMFGGWSWKQIDVALGVGDQFWVNNNLRLQIATVVVLKQLHQMAEQVHDCHHDEHLFPMVGLMYVVLFDEWLIM
jgi:hypothetical protein